VRALREAMHPQASECCNKVASPHGLALKPTPQLTTLVARCALQQDCLPMSESASLADIQTLFDPGPLKARKPTSRLRVHAPEKHLA
jgi:proline racemase